MSFLVENLEFYNKSGQRQNNTNYDSSLGYWKFELPFEEVSSGLFSTQQLHILERVKNLNDNVSSLFPPLTANSQQLKIKFKERDYQHFFLYRIQYANDLQNFYVESLSNNSNLYLQTNNEFLNNNDLNEDGDVLPGIKKIQDELLFDCIPTVEVESSNEVDSSGKSYLNPETGIREILNVYSTIDAITVNLGFTTELLGEFTETLEIYLSESGEDDIKIAEVSLFCESETEDERLTLLLENFGQSLLEDDSIVFRDTNVLDDKIDHKVTNQKKKELLIEYSNIIPYIGSYKGLMNALKFYGYSDLRIKEWWLNLSNEKIFHYEIDRETYKTIAPFQDTFGSNNVMKRTGKFSLFFNAFNLTGALDEEGLPQIEPAFPYSLDEILIKLYGLKKLLKEKYLPLNTRIVDITGEFIAFDRISSQSWSNSAKITSINEYELEAKIEVSPKIALLNKDSTVKYDIEPITYLSEISSLTISDIEILSIDDLTQQYSNVDHKKRKGYAEVTLKNLSFIDNINDNDLIFEEVPNITIERIKTYPIYEVQYDIICKEGPGFFKRLIGSPEDLEEVVLNLDVAGNYDVIVKFYDVYNNILIHRIPNLFRVELPKPIFGAIWNSSKEYKTWQDFDPNFKIGDAHLDILNQRQVDTVLEDLFAATSDSMNPGNYLSGNGICDTYKVPLLEIERNLQYVHVDKNLNIEDLEKQKYLTFIPETYSKEIVPKPIVSTNEIDSIKILKGEFPDIGDIVEIFEYLNITYENLTISGNHLTYSGILEIDNNSRFYIFNSDDIAHLDIVSYSINRKDLTTSFWVNDPDGLLAKSYTNAFIFKNPRALEVDSVTTDTLYHNIKLKSTIEMNLDVLQEQLNTSKDYRVWWNLSGGSYSIEIRSIETFEDYYKINLFDNERELFRVNLDYSVLLAPFDIEYAQKRLGKTSIHLEDFDFVSELGELEVDNCDWNGSVLPGFRIKNITSNGLLKINNSEWFGFSSGCSDDLSLALSELQNSDIPEFQNYTYYLNDSDEGEEYIQATSKYYGEDHLAIIEFKNGLDIEPKINPRYGCNYQLPPVMNLENTFTEGSINNRMIWNPLIREWVWQDETFEIEESKADPTLFIENDLIGNFQRHFGYSMNATLRGYNTKASDKLVSIKPKTIVGFYADASEVIGKQKYKWKFIKDSNNEVLGISENEFITFFFDEEGSYSVEVEIEDFNSNATSLRKTGFIQVRR